MIQPFLNGISQLIFCFSYRGISYDKVIVNILKAHSDAGNLILVINSADYEERCYKSQLDASFVHESSNNAKERYIYR